MPLCPRDKKLNYKIKFCKDKFKNKYRHWCEECEHFIGKKKGKKK
jgi:hypothetical protein